MLFSSVVPAFVEDLLISFFTCSDFNDTGLEFA